MPEDWNAVAREVAEAIASVGFTATLNVPNRTGGTEADPIFGDPTGTAITVIDDQVRRRDSGGTVTETVRVLTMSAQVVPVKGQTVVVRGETLRIGKVMPLAPGGIDLLFDVEVEA